MAVTYYTGIPRSGKSFKAVYKIYTTFVEQPPSKLDKLFSKISKKEKEQKYINCYTNINQFNFTISDKILKFEYDEIFDKLSILHSHYLDKKDDNFLIEKAKELNIFKTLFVIDEAHNYFKSKENPTLVWWLTYHGHLYHDIILITQDLKLVNDEYKRVGEFFYRTVPQRLRISKNSFKYREYSSYNMYQKDYIGTETIKADDKLFSLFVSGSHVNTTPIIYKYFIIFALLLVSLFFLYQNFMNTIDPTLETEQNQINQSEVKNETQRITNQIENTNSNLEAKQINEIELQLFKFECYSTYCYFNSLEVPQTILKPFLLNIDTDKKYIELKNNRLVIYVLEDKNKFNFLKGINDEKENKTNDFNILSGK